MRDRPDTIRSKIDRGFRLPGQAAALAVELFRLPLVTGDDEPSGLVRLFIERLSSCGMENVLNDQLAYATSLAASDGELAYEEMHKLMSLCDEIHAMRELGLTAARDRIGGWENAVRVRFARERAKARLVAEDKRENWNQSSWWYVENV